VGVYATHKFQKIGGSGSQARKPFLPYRWQIATGNLGHIFRRFRKIAPRKVLRVPADLRPRPSVSALGQPCPGLTDILVADYDVHECPTLTKGKGFPLDMQLTVRDVAKLLNVAEKTIYRWISQGNLPAYRVNEQYRFPGELLEWATPEDKRVEEQLSEPKSSGAPVVGSASGWESCTVEGFDKPSCCGRWSKTCAFPRKSIAISLPRAAGARGLGSTGIGGASRFRTCANARAATWPNLPLRSFPRHAIDFRFARGEPVDTLFSLVSRRSGPPPTSVAPLFALRDPRFKRSFGGKARAKKSSGIRPHRQVCVRSLANSPAGESLIMLLCLRGGCFVGRLVCLFVSNAWRPHRAGGGGGARSLESGGVRAMFGGQPQAAHWAWSMPLAVARMKPLGLVPRAMLWSAGWRRSTARVLKPAEKRHSYRLRGSSRLLLAA